MTGRAQLAAGVAIGGLAAVLITAGWLVRSSLDRRRLSGWLANGPRWSRGARACRLVTEVLSGW
jgi:hypothetical protein